MQRSFQIGALALLVSGSAVEATAYPSLSCVFTEPFVGVEVWPGDARLITPQATHAATTRVLGGTLLEPVVALTIDGKRVALRIENAPGSDGMSDFKRPLTGHLEGYVLASPQQGACLRYPDGTTPRPVIGVAATSRLNIRDRATPKARVIGQLGPRGRFWAFPEPTSGGWAHGAFEKLPTGGTGKIVVATGWVRAAKLGRPGA